MGQLQHLKILLVSRQVLDPVSLGWHCLCCFLPEFLPPKALFIHGEPDLIFCVFSLLF